jgi:hypothetical protein
MKILCQWHKQWSVQKGTSNIMYNTLHAASGLITSGTFVVCILWVKSILIWVWRLAEEFQGANVLCIKIYSAQTRTSNVREFNIQVNRLFQRKSYVKKRKWH